MSTLVIERPRLCKPPWGKRRSRSCRALRTWNSPHSKFFAMLRHRPSPAVPNDRRWSTRRSEQRSESSCSFPAEWTASAYCTSWRTFLEHSSVVRSTALCNFISTSCTATTGRVQVRGRAPMLTITRWSRGSASRSAWNSKSPLRLSGFLETFRLPRETGVMPRRSASEHVCRQH